MCDLPLTLAVTHQEVALLKAFLGAEIDAILSGQDSRQGD
jgi:hypothetical protein